MQINLFILQTALQLPNDLIPVQENDYNALFPNTLISLASWIKALKAWNLRQLNDTSPASGLPISISDIRTYPLQRVIAGTRARRRPKKDGLSRRYCYCSCCYSLTGQHKRAWRRTRRFVSFWPISSAWSSSHTRAVTGRTKNWAGSR